MKNRQRMRTAAMMVAVGLVATVALVSRAKASIGTVTKSDLSGAWQGTFFGSTGCGISTEVFSFTLNTSGSGTARSLTG